MNKLEIKIIQCTNRTSSANYSFAFELPTGHGTVYACNFNSELDAEKHARAAVRSLECTRDCVLAFNFIKAALAV